MVGKDGQVINPADNEVTARDGPERLTDKRETEKTGDERGRDTACTNPSFLAPHRSHGIQRLIRCASAIEDG